MCQPEHVPAIEARLGIREGDMVTPKAEEAEETDKSPFIGNANVLVL